MHLLQKKDRQLNPLKTQVNHLAAKVTGECEAERRTEGILSLLRKHIHLICCHVLEIVPEVSIILPSPQDTSNNLEADDSKTNASLIEGRGWGSRTTRSMAR